MESLYTTYRPQTFEDVAGQRAIVGALERAVVNQTVGHAYLFCGPRGTGKTTLARILAKALECDAGPGVLPDGTCEQCEAIALGIHPDVQELDAASRNGVNDIRDEVISKVNFAPVRGRYKVYIIDEVHMLSTAAFNALLKTLEEPPEHVVFIFCTTDPQKVLPTVLSRVQRFNFSPLSDEDIRHRLEVICEREGFEVTPEAMTLIVRHAHGGMRDAISTLEQLAVFGDGRVDEAMARDLLGKSDEDTLTRFVEALAARDAGTLFSLVGSIVSEGRDLQQFNVELMGRVRDLYVVGVAGAIPGVVTATEEELAELQREVPLFGGPDRLSRILGELDSIAYGLRTAPDPRLVFEVALTRLARPECDLTLESLVERIERLEHGRTSMPQGEPTPQVEPTPMAPPRPTRSVPATAARVAPSASRTRGSTPTPRSDGMARPTTPSTSAPMAAAPAAPAPMAPTPAAAAPAPAAAVPPMGEAPVPSAVARESARRTAAPPAPEPDPAPRKVAPTTSAPPAPAPPSGAADDGRWRQVVASLPAYHATFLQDSTVIADDGAKLCVGVPGESHFTLSMLNRDDVKPAIEQAATRVYGPRAIAFEAVDGAPSGAPARPDRGSGSTAAPTVPGDEWSARGATGANLPPGPGTDAPARPSPRPQPAPWDQPRAQAPARPGQSAQPGQPAQPVPPSRPVQPAQSDPRSTPEPRASVGYGDIPPTSVYDDVPPWEEVPPAPSRPTPPPAQAPSSAPRPPAPAPAPPSATTVDPSPGGIPIEDLDPKFTPIVDALNSAFGSIEVLGVEPPAQPAPGAGEPLDRSRDR